ncbi:PREDICTED: GATA transcription factor 9-like [Nicotiana attenuata]|uniref:GATA transcription factor n=1 Tax=Nicotiana attenuata TaxID=49451 RepID=A0A314KJB3_NICAT|nr:PREDICTED: GATA transcription factor 9-like [Nicotiana attenuata]OIT28779.1 gata transcription factor 9 [Nicotiana attenuata]
METPDCAAAGYFAHSIDYQFEHKPFDSTNNNINNNHITVDDLLDFNKENEVMTDAFFDTITGANSADSSSLTVVDSCNSLVSGGEGHFDGNLSYRSFTDTPFLSSELCVPHDDLAELEWLSNFVEESFSTEDLQNLQFIPVTEAPSTTTTSTDNSSSGTVISSGNYHNTTGSNSPPAFPCKSRSKRSRAAPCDWSSRLLLLPPATASSLDSNSSLKTAPCRMRESTDTNTGRKCKHCGSEMTPQWRTGPMGPKTLCNACGVRYKSGRLVPEYRPAASPTFVSTEHSNSHRKVIELRRQKELRTNQIHQLQML